jgi:hypothetical protein
MAHQCADPTPPKPAPLPAAVAWPGGAEDPSGPMPLPCAGSVGLAKWRVPPRRGGARGSGEPAVSASVPTESNCGIAVVAPAATLAAFVKADEPGAEDRAGVPGLDLIAGRCDRSRTFGSIAVPKAVGWGAVAGVAGAAAAAVGSTVAVDVTVNAGLGGGGVVAVARTAAVGVGAGGAVVGVGGGAGAPAVLGAAVVVGTEFKVRAAILGDGVVVVVGEAGAGEVVVAGAPTVGAGSVAVGARSTVVPGWVLACEPVRFGGGSEIGVVSPTVDGVSTAGLGAAGSSWWTGPGFVVGRWLVGGCSALRVSTAGPVRSPPSSGTTPRTVAPTSGMR